MFLCQHFSLFFCLASFFTKKKKTERNKQRKFSVIRYTHWQRGFVQHILEVMYTKFASKFSSVNHLFIIWVVMFNLLVSCCNNIYRIMSLASNEKTHDRYGLIVEPYYYVILHILYSLLLFVSCNTFVFLDKFYFIFLFFKILI